MPPDHVYTHIDATSCDDAFGTIPTPTPVPTKTPAELDWDIVISFLETSQADRSRFLIERGSETDELSAQTSLREE